MTTSCACPPHHGVRQGTYPARQVWRQDIIERSLYPLPNEGIRILEEGVALRAPTVDAVRTAGCGLPRYRGGSLFSAGTIAPKALPDGMHQYQRVFGPRHWQPAALQEPLAPEGTTLTKRQAARA